MNFSSQNTYILKLKSYEKRGIPSMECASWQQFYDDRLLSGDLKNLTLQSYSLSRS